MDLPPWHETQIDPRELVNLTQIAQLPGAPGHDALRSYATGRRQNAILGPMPDPVAFIANRRLWLRRDIELWLICPIPSWRRSKATLQEWIDKGRPRALP